MIKIFYEGKHPYVSFSGNSFSDLLEVAHDCSLSFDKELKAFKGKAYQVLDFIDAVIKVEKVYVDRDILSQLRKEASDAVETKFDLGIQFDETLLEYPPIAPYQIEDIKKGISQSRLAYFLDMGLGKTYIIANVIKHLWSNNKVKRIVVLSPQEGLYNFKRNMLQFASSIFKSEDIIIGSVLNRHPFESDAKMIILSYRTWLMICEDAFKEKMGHKFRKKGDSYKSVLDLSSWIEPNASMLIADESHNMKNYATKTYKWVQTHIDYFEYRYILTGTPTPNEFIEIYSQMKLLDPMAIPFSYSQYKMKIANLGNRFSAWAINGYKEEEVVKEQNRMKPWIVRRKSEDYLDLPELYIDKTYLEITPVQRRIYQKLVVQELTVLKEKQGELIPREVFQKFPYLSLALDDPILLKGKISKEANPSLYQDVEKWNFTQSAKYEALDSLLESWVQDEHRKVVVFDFHPAIIEKLGECFDKYNPIVIHGNIHSADRKISDSEYRATLLDEFRKKKDRHVLFASSLVLKTAVDITEANRAVYYSRNFSYLVWSQSMKRLHRIGQEERVIVKPFILDGTLNLIGDSIIDKKANLDKIVFKDNLTLDQWQKIFGGDIKTLLTEMEIEEYTDDE